MGVLTLPSSSLKGRRFADTSILRWRERPSFGIGETCVLVLYTALLSITLPYHEPWADEAQAWLIARDNSFWQIFHHRLHYEGSPLLWHFILRVLHLLHVPWPLIGYCGAAFAIAGIFVWLRWSPLPLLLRYLFPFTFFLQYQYAVVARSYVLFPLLLFSLCVLYRARTPRPIPFAITSGLLANLCMQGMVLSVALTVLYGVELWKRREFYEGFRPTPSSRRLLAACALWFGLCGASIYAAIPAPDVGFAVGDQVSDGLAHRILLHLVGETPKNHPTRIPPDYTPEQWTAIVDAAVPPEPQWSAAPREWLAWQMRAPESQRAFSNGLNGVLYPLIEIPSELFWPIATVNSLAFLFIVSLIFWAVRRRAFKYFLPMFALLIVGEFLWIADHHTGMLLVTAVGGVWLAATKPQDPIHENAAADLVFLSVAAGIFLLQVGWSATAILHDRNASYDPSSETARFLHTKRPGTRMVAFHFWSTGIQPYFEHNPFVNLPSSWWQWCSNITVDAAHSETIAARPDVVVYTYENPGPDSMRNQIIPLNQLTGYEPVDPILNNLKMRNYRETHRFCGRRFDRWSAAYTICDVIFEPRPSGVTQ